MTQIAVFINRIEFLICLTSTQDYIYEQASFELKKREPRQFSYLECFHF
jgi:hypothetical protein